MRHSEIEAVLVDVSDIDQSSSQSEGYIESPEPTDSSNSDSK